MLVKKNDVLYEISTIKRLGKCKGDWFLAEGYPIQSAVVCTVHKAQGKTYSSIVVHIPKVSSYVCKHLYYVAISRCKTASTVHFYVDGYNGTGLKEVHKRLYSPNGGDQHIAIDRYMKNLMAYTEKGGPISEFPDADPVGMNDDIDFPTMGNMKMWEHKVPTQVKTIELNRLFGLYDTIVYDSETGAGVGFENHKDIYTDGRISNTANTMRHGQEAWLISFLHIRQGKIVWLKSMAHSEHITCPEDRAFLLELSRSQTHDGYVHILLDKDERDRTSKIFMQYLIIVCKYNESYKLQITTMRPLTRLEMQPCVLVGFNSDNFDTKNILGRLCKDKLPTHFRPFIVPNNGHSITKLIIGTEQKKTIGNLLVTHDIFRVLGCVGSLDGCHKSYVRDVFGSDRDKYIKYCKLFTTDPVLIDNLASRLVVGKTAFPHYITQREGYKAIMTDEIRECRIEDFLLKDRDAVKNKEDRTFNLREKGLHYMVGDLIVLLQVILALSDMVYDKCGVPLFQINTAQQLTITSQLYCGTDVPGIISKRSEKHPSEKTVFRIRMSLPSIEEQIFIDSAIYGGKTTPRFDHWDVREGYGSYTQLDESGMYADALEKGFYPYGIHHTTIQPTICRKVMELWNGVHPSNARALLDPRTVTGEPFSHYFIALVEFRTHPLCPDPCIPFINEESKLDWGTCNNSSTTGIRTQVLTNVHLATLKMTGGELLSVKKVMYWENYGPVYAKYLKILNRDKYTTKDVIVKMAAKLLSNAMYGAVMTHDHDTFYGIFEKGQKLKEALLKLDLNQIYSARTLSNNKYAIQGHALDLNKTHSSRPNYQGCFVLARSQYKLAKVHLVGYGPTYLPTSIADAREGLLCQIAYGDTDSAFVHESHIQRLLDYADRTGERLLHDHTLRPIPSEPTEDDLLDQLGKYCDEVSNDNKLGHMVDFRSGRFSRLLRFAAAGPKAYVAIFQCLDGKIRAKIRIKGVKDGSVVDVMDTTTGCKRRRDEDNEYELIFSKKDLRLAEELIEVIKDPDLKIQTLSTGTLKLLGLVPPSHEVLREQDGMIIPSEPFSIMTTNINRGVLGSITTRRRKLTQDEIDFLGLSSYDAARLRVPNGYNYDGSLFELS
jgi:hypothetical protein